MVFTGNAKDYIDEAYYKEAYIQHIKTQEKNCDQSNFSKTQMTIQALQKELGSKLSNASKESTLTTHKENVTQ